MWATDLLQVRCAQTLNLFLGRAEGAHGDKPLLAAVPEVEFANCALGKLQGIRGVPSLSSYSASTNSWTEFASRFSLTENIARDVSKTCS